MNKLLKILVSIPLFLILSVIYYYLIMLIIMAPIFLFANDDFLSSGIWVVFIVLGIIVSLIMSFKSVSKILFNSKKEITNSNLYDQYNKIVDKHK